LKNKFIKLPSLRAFIEIKQLGEHIGLHVEKIMPVWVTQEVVGSVKNIPEAGF